MRIKSICMRAAALLAAALCSAFIGYAASPAANRPAALRVDALTKPLGMDSARPMLSWQLTDATQGAKQIAYRITVYSRQPKADSTTPDVWDSGRIVSRLSTGVPYAGPALHAEQRYYWRVQVWNKDNHPYPVSETSWFETGLQSPENWKAQWIGYESPELHSIRESGAVWLTSNAPSATLTHDTHQGFRFPFTVDRPIKQAAFYVAGEDTPSAWINGRQILAPQPLTPWQHMPWASYTRHDVTAQIHSGSNMLAIGTTHYLLPGAKSVSTHSPMSSCLYLLFQDGSTRLYSTASPGWQAVSEPAAGWWQPTYSEAHWQPATPYVQPAGDFSQGSAPILPWPTGPVAALRHTFREDKSILSARLYATALGAYMFSINGAPVGDQILAPGWMDFRQHVPYQTYDVTAQIKMGNNAIAAYLAPGWYSTPLKWLRQGNNYGPTQPALKAQLRIEHADGSVDWIATDPTWKAADSAITEAEIYDGETMDARLAAPGWEKAAFSDSAWHAAMLVNPEHEPRIIAQYFPPIRAERTLTVKTITHPAPGVTIFDFGQNMSALPLLRVRGKRGDTIQLRFGEVLNDDGTLYTENLRTAKATDRYTLATSGKLEVFEPQFTFHGFRYAEITGLSTPATAETLHAVVLHTDAPFTAQFSTGDTMINKLWSNILWGQRSNFVGVPTDCPQRDERLGWSADAQVFWRTATYNMDLATFSQKYAADLAGTQATTPMYGIYAPGVETPNPGFGAAWSDAGVIVPWTGWIQSGNPRIVNENWDGMARYLADIESQNPDHLWRIGFGIPFGDWLTPTITTPEDLLATAYWAYDVTLMQQMAQATGRDREAALYQALFVQIKAAFTKAYIRSDGFVGAVDNYPSIPPPTIHPEAGDADRNHLVETQTGYVLALYMHLVPENLREAAAKKLVDKVEANHGLLGTGFLGTPYLLAVLTDTGHADLAYHLLLNRDYPSWGYLIDHGATTTWERWNGDTMRNDPSMNSYNHYAYGAVAEWLYRYAAGVDTLPAGPGFQTIYLHPNFDARLGHLDFTYDSPYGPIHSAWAVRGQVVTWQVTVPPNATAILPPLAANATHLAIEGKPLAQRLQPGEHGSFLLPAGTYTFTATLVDSQAQAKQQTAAAEVPMSP